MAENSIINYSNIIGDDGSFKKLFSLLDELEAKLEKLAKDKEKQIGVVNPDEVSKIQKLEKEITELETAYKNLQKQKKVAATQQKKLNDLTKEELINREAEKLANRERVQRAKQLAIIRKEEKNTIASLRAQLSLVTLDWKKLTAEEAENGDKGRKLVAQKKALTAQLKKLEKATGDNRREVGNYTLATKGLSSTLKRLFVGRTIADGILRLGGALADVVEKNKDTNKELGKLSKTFTIVKNVAEDLAVAFLEFVATPVSDFLLNVAFAVEKVKNFFTQARESTGAFSIAIDFVTESISLMLTPVKLLFKFLTDFPAIIGGVINVFSEFSTVASSTFENLSIRAERAFLQVEQGIKSIAGVDTTDIENRINRLSEALRANQERGEGLFGAYQRGYEEVKEQQEAFNKAQEDRAKKQEKEGKAYQDQLKRQNKALEDQKRVITEINNLTNVRLLAIINLQEKIRKAEVGNIEDRQAQLLELEDLAAKELQKQRDENFNLFVSNLEKQEELLISIYGKNGKEVVAFRDQASKDLLELEKLNQQLEAEQLEASEKRKLEIRKKFAKEVVELEVISVLESNKETKTLLDEKVALIEDSNEKAKKSNEEYFNSLIESSKKVADKINEAFEKTTEASIKAVESQAEAVERQRDRAEQGLSNTLKFEEEELARKEAEKVRAEQAEQRAAKLLALYSLVAAYAQNGDEKALQRGLADFALLEVAANGLQGFYEGTEHVGNALGDNAKYFNTGKDDYLGVANDKLFRFDGSERILNGLDNAKLKGMTNSDLVSNALLGMQINDTNMLSYDQYDKQYNDIKKAVGGNRSDNFDISVLVDEMKKTRLAIQKQPSNNFDIEKVTDMFIQISKKTISNNAKRSERLKKRM